jgi:hypothetical protein
MLLFFLAAICLALAAISPAFSLPFPPRTGGFALVAGEHRTREPSMLD